MPANNRFKVSLSTGFIYKEVVDEFAPYIDSRAMLADSVLSYVNSTISDASIAGINVPVTEKQIKNAGATTKIFAGATSYLENMNKEIQLSFSLKSSYLNWAIMYKQITTYLERKPFKSDTHMPPIFMDVMDIDGIIIFRMEFREIIPLRLSDLKASYGSRIDSNKFDLNFSYNHMDLQFKVKEVLRPDIRYTY